MRVTNQMISSQVVFNLSRSLNRFMNLQAMMSTGRRILKPSDDPVGTQKDLRYRYTLAEIGQFKKNISSSLNLMSNYDTTLMDIKNALTSVYEMAVDMAGEDGDIYTNAGEVASDQVQDLLDSIISMTNTRMNGRYIFSGFKTNIAAFQASADGVRYTGDAGSVKIEIESGTRIGMNLIGSDLMMTKLSTIGEKADLKVGINNNTLLVDLDLGAGIDQAPGTFTITDNNLGINVTIDLSAETTIGDVINKINADLVAAPPNDITNLTVSLGPEGNNLRFSTVSNGLISTSTPLSNLNAGSGVDLLNGTIRIHDITDSINLTVDLKSAGSVGDVINAINTALDNDPNPLAANVNAVINAAGTGIDIVDGNGVPLGLQIEEASGSATTAADLGLIGNIDPTLNGTALNPKLDFSIAEAALGQTTASDLGILGNFSINKSGDGLRPTIQTTTPLSVLNNNNGFPLGQIKISQGARMVYLDLSDPAYTTVDDLINAINSVGLDITASINADQTGIQIESTLATESLKIEDVGDNRAARTLGILGSPDIFGSIMILTNSLRNDDYEITGQMIGNLEESIQQVLSSLASIGARVNRLEATDSRLTSMDFNFATLLSEEEDADLTRLVTDLAAQENSYQAAMIAAAKIIQPSLLNFLK